MHFRQPLKALLVTGTALALALPAVAAGAPDRPLQLSQATPPAAQQDRAGQKAPADRQEPQRTTDGQAQQRQGGQQARGGPGQPFEIITQSRALRSMPVVNGKGERLGQIYDIIVSTQNRSVLYALLAASSAPPPAAQATGEQREREAGAAQQPAAARERLYPIPFGTLRIADRSEMRIAGSAEAPRQADDRADDAGRGDDDETPRRLVDLTVDDIDGMSVVNGWGEGVADVEEVIRGPGGVPMAVLGVGGFLGMGEKYITVSLADLQYDSAEDNLVTAMSRDEVERAPAIEFSDSDELGDDEVVGSLLAEAGLAAGMDERGELRNKVLVLDVEKAQLANAPSFDRGEFPNLADRRWHDSIVAFYTTLFESSDTPRQARGG